MSDIADRCRLPTPRRRCVRCIIAGLAEMTPSEWVRIMADLWETGHAFSCAGVRQQFPEADEDQVMAAARFGEELARKVYGR